MGVFLTESRKIGSVEFTKPKPSSAVKIVAAWSSHDEIYLKTISGKIICARINRNMHKQFCFLPTLGYENEIKAMWKLGFITEKEFTDWKTRATKYHEDKNRDSDLEDLKKLARKYNYKLEKQK